MPKDASPSEPQEHRYSSPIPMNSWQDRGDVESSLLDLLIILAKRKRLIFTVTAVFAIFASLISLLLPVRYTAMVVLLPPQQSPSMDAQLASPLENLGGMANLTDNSSYNIVGTMTSRTIEDAMVQHFDLMREYHKQDLSDARKAFETYATVDDLAMDGLIRISVEDRDPHRAADLANGYVDQFRNQSQSLFFTEASQRRHFFEQQLEQAKDNLANAEEAMKQTEQKTGAIQLDSQVRALIESAASLRAQVAAKEVQIQGMRTYATGENAQLVQAQQELESMRAQLTRLGGSEDNASGGMILPKGQVPEAGLEYVRKLRDVKYNETLFDILARKFEAAKLDEARQGALIQVVDTAIPPTRPSSPKRALIVILSTTLGFLFGSFTALLLDAFQRLQADRSAQAKLALLKRYLSVKKPETS